MSGTLAVLDGGGQRWSILLENGAKLVIQRPKRNGHVVKASVELRRNGSLVYQDTVTLTSARRRNGFVAEIETQRPGEFPDLPMALLALSSRVSEIATTRATPAPVETTELTDEQRDGLRRQAAPIIESPDPWALIRDALKQGYGGNPIAPETVYLAMTTRLLLMREGEIPGHLCVLGPSSAGKTYAVSRAARLMPPEALVEYEAGSSRVLIYDERPLRHREVHGLWGDRVSAVPLLQGAADEGPRVGTFDDRRRLPAQPVALLIGQLCCFNWGGRGASRCDLTDTRRQRQ